MILIKIGGGSTINLEGIIQDLSSIEEPFIIIHGANSVRDSLAISLNKPKKILTSVKGYSSVYSDDDAIDLLYMTYAGLINKKLVELAQRLGINAIGLSGIDGRLIQGQRNKGIRVMDGEKKKIIRDRSGRAKSINKDLIMLLIENGFIPIISIPIIDENGFAINSENDDIVALFQETFNFQKIIFLIEAPGLLKDASDDLSVLKQLSIKHIEEYESKETGRIKRKFHALKRIAKCNSSKIIIGDGRVDHPIKEALLEKGTVINQTNELEK